MEETSRILSLLFWGFRSGNLGTETKSLEPIVQRVVDCQLLINQLFCCVESHDKLSTDS